MKNIHQILKPARKGVRVTAAALLLAMSAPMAQAQVGWYVPRYITGDVGGGLQSIQFNPRDGKHKVGAGFHLNAGAVFMIDAHWGVATGVGMASYASKTIFNDMMEGSFAVDSSINVLNHDTATWVNPQYEFRTYFRNFTEKQKLLQIEVPIAAYFQYPIDGRMDVVGRAGFKFGIPVSSKYKLMKGTYETRAFFETGVEYDSLPQHGFYTTEVNKEKGKCKLNPINLSLMLEGGVTYKFTKTLRAYAGINFSYCLTNIHKETIEPILTTERKYNGTLCSNRIDRASLISVGASAGVIWDFWLAHYKTKPKF